MTNRSTRIILRLFTGLIKSKIAYALPAFAGQLSADDRNGISAITKGCASRRHTHCFRYWGNHRQWRSQTFYPYYPTRSLFISSFPLKTTAYCPLRKRQHSHQLQFSQYKNSFISRCLFKMRWLIIFIGLTSLFFVHPCSYVFCCFLMFSFLKFILAFM